MSRPLSQASAPHWAEIDEFSFVTGMRLLLWLYRCLGRWPFRLLLCPVVILYLTTQRAARKSSRDYLSRLAAWRGDCASNPSLVLAAKVERGEFIAIAGDRIPVSLNARVAFARFLGTSAPFPIGPYVLASLLNCPMYTIFALRRGRISEIHLELFQKSIRLPRQERDAALQALAAEYAARLERFCLAAPFHWFNFYDFWRFPESLVADANPRNK